MIVRKSVDRIEAILQSDAATDEKGRSLVAEVSPWLSKYVSLLFRTLRIIRVTEDDIFVTALSRFLGKLENHRAEPLSAATLAAYARYSVLEAHDELVPRRERQKATSVVPWDPVHMDGIKQTDDHETQSQNDPSEIRDLRKRMLFEFLMQCVAKLSQGQQEVVRHVFWNKWSKSSAARELNTSRQNINNKLKRALAVLRKCMQSVREEASR